MMLFDIDRLVNFTVTPVPRFWFMLLQGTICSQARKNLLPKRVVKSQIKKFDISANAHVTRIRVAGVTRTRVYAPACAKMDWAPRPFVPEIQVYSQVSLS